MSIKVLYLAKSGAGKSSSYCQIESLDIKGLDPKTTGIINVAGKELNMRRWREHYNKKAKNYIVSKDPQAIVKYLEIYKGLDNIKNIIIDDFQYAFSLNFIDKIRVKKGENGFDKYNDVLVDIKTMFTAASEMREDQIVYFYHT